MSCRTAMIHRIRFQRNSATVNPYGTKSPPDWGALSTIAGRAWSTSGAAELDAEGTKARVEAKAMVPIGTDVTRKDRIEKVTDRSDTELFGVMYISTILPRRDHLELHMRYHE